MDHFYYVRHGETEANQQGLMCGSAWDIPLNDAGLEQARQAAELFRANVKDIKTICVSPMVRARRTAEIINHVYNLELKAVEDLKEWHMGHWDRLRFEDVKEEFFGGGEPKGGELRAEFHARVARAFEHCKAQTAPLLIVAHGAVWLALQQHLGMEPVRIKNGHPHRVTKVGNVWRAEAL